MFAQSTAEFGQTELVHHNFNFLSNTLEISLRKPEGHWHYLTFEHSTQILHGRRGRKKSLFYFIVTFKNKNKENHKKTIKHIKVEYL